MDPNSERKFSFPNADQNIPGASGSFRPQDPSTAQQPRRTVNIVDALAAHKEGETADDARTVRTYQADVADAIKNDNVSMIKIALAEKKRQEKQQSPIDLGLGLPQSNNKIYLIVGGIIAFIVIAGLIGGYFLLQSNTASQSAIENQQPQYQPLVYTETASEISVDDRDSNDIFRQITLDKNAVMDVGTMKGLVLTTGTGSSTQILTTSDFFIALGTRAPGSLVRSLDSNFTLGVYAYTPREMFAIFKVNTYDTAFAGMLEWEPNIDSDIGEAFLSKKEEKPAGTGIASSTASSTSQGTSTPFSVFSNRTFVDRIVNNKDARVLIDADGTPRMLYTFLDKETLVIATSERSLKEIVFRLTTGRIVR